MKKQSCYVFTSLKCFAKLSNWLKIFTFVHSSSIQVKILLRSFKNECCCFSYFLCGSRHCFFSETEKNIAGFCLRTLLCCLFLPVLPVWAGSWYVISLSSSAKNMTNEKDAFFWLCQFFHPSALCHRAWFHYIKDTCVKSCTPRLIYFFAQLYYWAWLYTVVII